MGNALVDIMMQIDNDLLLSELSLPKGSMQLVGSITSQNILEKTKNLSQTLACGGSAANTIRVLARIGAETSFFGKVGKDEYGDFYISDMINSGVETHIIQSETPTGKAIALVSPDANRTFATHLGAACELLPEDITPNIYSGASIFYIEGYLVQNHELIEKSLKTAYDCDLITVLDLASFNVVEENLDFLQKLATNYVDIIFANEEESFAFTGEKDTKKALEIISSYCDIAILKLGGKGSLVKSGNFIHFEPAIKINAIDSTGAGDFYAAGFLFAYTKKYTLDICANLGTLLAGHVMEFIGPRLDEQTWFDINKKIKKYEYL